MDTEKKTAAAAVVYTVAEFRAAAKKLFGVGAEVIDGAVYGKEKETYTVDEMQSLITAFLQKPIGKGGI